MPRGKTNAIEQLINSKYSNGTEITVAQLAQEVDCTVQNVYLYIRKNPSRFIKVRRGVYKVHTSMSDSAGQNSSNNMTFDNSQSN
jgi:5-bromo-4-chloroindolyl phosphate hydrolysis protein